MENCLLLIQKMHADGAITDDQRDQLKGKYTSREGALCSSHLLLIISILTNINLYYIDMLFDEDSILLSFFERYSDPNEEEDLKNEVVKYVSSGQFAKASEDQSTGESLDEVSVTTINEGTHNLLNH